MPRRKRTKAPQKKQALGELFQVALIAKEVLADLIARCDIPLTDDDDMVSPPFFTVVMLERTLANAIEFVEPPE